ncbi:hypothetical protein [Thiomicrorhabdus heinhorstiae]|uniref:Uncharacterized protein n=1 Tax=Thiomicrorhabdus heinhorstiae TaxID=2748010 RepID=A0ABS0BS66_9GAMM|nr:hypothetical protein [Thiomicrorhabdus heinhorstiae]MBF6056728.1 hypothetical protein [Thiomicrorhabdus heinhorstiae]
MGVIVSATSSTAGDVFSTGGFVGALAGAFRVVLLLVVGSVFAVTVVSVASPSAFSSLGFVFARRTLSANFEPVVALVVFAVVILPPQ